MEKSSAMRKRIQFGSVFIVHVPAVSDSQSSSLVNSQAVSSALRASVTRALPFLSALDHNAVSSPRLLCGKGNEGTLLLGGGCEDEDNAKTLDTPPKTLPKAQSDSGRCCTSRTQQPRLALDPLLASSLGRAMTEETQDEDAPSYCSVIIDDGEESHTLDSEAGEEDQFNVASQHHPEISATLFITKSSATDISLQKSATPPRRSSPPRASQNSPTFSQLIAAVDEVLYCSPNEPSGDALPASSCQTAPPAPDEQRDSPITATTTEMQSSPLAPNLRREALIHTNASCSLTTDILARTLQHSSSPAITAVRSNHDDDAKSNTKGSAVCVFCSRSSMAQRHQLRAPPLLFSEGYSYHLACALWCPEVCTDPSTQLLRGITEAVQRSRHIKCALCRQPGAAIGCAVSTCQLSFHLPCAVKARAEMDRERFVLRCPADKLRSHKGEKRKRHRAELCSETPGEKKRC